MVARVWRGRAARKALREVVARSRIKRLVQSWKARKLQARFVELITAERAARALPTYVEPLGLRHGNNRSEEDEPLGSRAALEPAPPGLYMQIRPSLLPVATARTESTGTTSTVELTTTPARRHASISDDDDPGASEEEVEDSDETSAVALPPTAKNWRGGSSLLGGLRQSVSNKASSVRSSSRVPTLTQGRVSRINPPQAPGSPDGASHPSGFRLPLPGRLSCARTSVLYRLIRPPVPESRNHICGRCPTPSRANDRNLRVLHSRASLPTFSRCKRRTTRWRSDRYAKAR